MNRRPWPIVILALIQIFSPLLGLIAGSMFYGVSLGTLFEEQWQFSSNWQKIETYLIPVVVGLLIYFTRRIGYYLALLGCFYMIYRNMVEFVISEREAPVWPTILANLVVAGMIAYLLLPKVRMIYLNPALRWWETAPRFLVSWVARLQRPGLAAVEVKLHDISIGGAALEAPTGDFLNEEEVLLDFEHDTQPFEIKGRVVYAKTTPSGSVRLGLKWSDSNSNADRSKIRRLVRKLHAGGVPVSRRLPDWWDDFKDWLPKALHSKDAWLPGAPEHPQRNFGEKKKK